MKKKFRYVEGSVNQTPAFVISAKCSCPAGNSEFCNHIMTLDYPNLNQFNFVPEDISCTKKSQQWHCQRNSRNAS